MEILTDKESLLKAINLVGSVTVQKSTTLPILGNVLMEALDEGVVNLVGTDLEVGICIQVPATVKKAGTITVPAKKMHEIIRELPDGEPIELIVAKNNAVNIKTKKSFFKVMGLGKEDYPKLPTWSEDNALEVEQAVLKEGISLTSFAISYDETRYVLNGVLISVKDDKIRFVATDGRRLAFVEKPFINTTKKDFDVIVPIKALVELNKQLTWEGSVKLIPSQNQIVFRFAEGFLVSRLIEGNYPNYEQVIPKNQSTLTSASRDELLQAIRRTSLLATPESPAVKLDFLKGKILVSSRSPNLGEAKEELAADVDGKELAIGFNPNYLIDVLKNLDVEKVSLALTDPDKPGLLQGKEGYLYVIMPMQLN